MALGQTVGSYNHWHITHRQNTVRKLDRSWVIALREIEFHAIVEGKTLRQPGKKAWPSKVF
jgi:hypothetical protein